MASSSSSPSRRVVLFKQGHKAFIDFRSYDEDVSTMEFLEKVDYTFSRFFKMKMGVNTIDVTIQRTALAENIILLLYQRMCSAWKQSWNVPHFILRFINIHCSDKILKVFKLIEKMKKDYADLKLCLDIELVMMRKPRCGPTLYDMRWINLLFWLDGPSSVVNKELNIVLRTHGWKRFMEKYKRKETLDAKQFMKTRKPWPKSRPPMAEIEKMYKRNTCSDYWEFVMRILLDCYHFEFFKSKGITVRFIIEGSDAEFANNFKNEMTFWIKTRNWDTFVYFKMQPAI